MSFQSSFDLEQYFSSQLDVFTVEDLYKYLRVKGIRMTKNQIRDVLNTSEMIFPLIDGKYITRAGVFTGRLFSFKPTKEEIKKGYIVFGHRCMPFINPQISPDKITVIYSKKIVEPETATFSMNLAMDLFALFGEGYVIPYIFNDSANVSKTISSVKYNMPTEITLTAWPLKKMIGKNQKIKYGDRLLCRVLDWEHNAVEITVLQSNETTALSSADIEREEWYLTFERELLNSFDKIGPGNSIEEQLAFLYLENQSDLCTQNCGSAEEFLQHTKKIGFSHYGVESRIWRTGEEVPYIGPWNEDCASESIFSEMTVYFSPEIVRCYLKNRIYEMNHKKKVKSLEELCQEIFPATLKMTSQEFKLLLLNIEKCNDIINETYNQFIEHDLEPVRKRVLSLFSQVHSLLCSIGNSGLQLKMLPQQELIILIQLFTHVSRIIEEMEDSYGADHFPIDDVCLSLEGMEDTFDEISGILNSSLDVNTYKGIKIVN